MRHARRFASQRLAIRAILERFPDATIVAVRSPFDLECASGARHALATYGDESVSLHGLARVVFGGEPARALPVELANGVDDVLRAACGPLFTGAVARVERAERSRSSAHTA